jgi:UDP-2-acetamido-3-amino-2,3-dideoxy-glucuronate N-acetyltransferase
VIAEDVKVGKGTIVYHPELVNLYGCTIGEECKIATYVEIQRDVVIGIRCKIESGAFIPSGVIIEDGVFIGPNVVFCNDMYPRAVNDKGELLGSNEWKITSTLVKKGASIGANSTIVCGVTIGEGSLIGAGSVIRRNVPANQLWVGNPAVKVRNLK